MISGIFVQYVKQVKLPLVVALASESLSTYVHGLSCSYGYDNEVFD